MRGSPRPKHTNKKWRQNNYYPFGLKHQGYNNLSGDGYKYKLNGKEYEDAFGLNIYEMDLRQLDPAIGRWVVQDPVVHHDYSPYSAFDNNPVYWSDPSGADSQKNITIADLFNKAGSGTTTFSFENGQLVGESFAENIKATLEKSYLFLDAPTDDNGDGGGNGDGSGKNKGANNKGIGTISVLGVKIPTFFGAPVNVIPGDFKEASFFKGMINISQASWNRYKTLGLDSSTGRLLMHEYGHFLQRLMGGTIQYDYVAISSFIDFLQTDYEGHQKHWSEIQASTLAAYYFDFNKGFLKENLIDDRYVNELILQSLKGGYQQHPNYKP
ncbi:RHS repeat-associated core domain-containing protein [Myroides sp. JBRI-B21084]|uniref:RHS repeat-associated core domain-containing protein n=1 Tax=Myroides sp. JBRI-B21084 TaxID=3119977 RepID=UPI0026E11BC2|nr:RHS repeat-associated core domain-containing protein [Paenimyroides cloacae]WKW46716.1 RHS repeat-associated core domain-containing protein [Paenimyroides cloacae]